MAEVPVPGNEDRQVTPYLAETSDVTSLIVCPTYGKPLETTPRGKNYYDRVTGCILAGESKKAESHAGYVLPSTTVVAGEIIAPLGKSGAGTRVHLHLQISSPDPVLNDNKNPADPSFNDGWDNVAQYLVRSSSTFSGGISSPTANTLLYHTNSHDFERVIAAIRQRPVGADYQTYHAYELDRVRIFAVPSGAITNAADFLTVLPINTYLINGSRDVHKTLANQLPDSSDTFRAEFDYGGTVAATDNAFPPFISNTGAYYKSDGKRTGLLPEGDLDANPVTDFVFNQWNTRINKDFSGLAYRSEDAAYPDGEYALLAVAESVDRDPLEMFVSTPVEVGIDNFRPYLEDVKLFDENNNSQLARQHSWLLAGSLLVSSEPLKSYIVPGEYTLSATFSEKMDMNQVYLGLQGGEGINKNVFYSTETHKSKAEGRLSISPADFPQDAVTYVVVGGTDIAGKGLLKVSPDDKTIDPALKLTRDAAGDMQGEGGYDTSTELRIEASPPSIAWAVRGTNYSCNGVCGTEAEPINLAYNSTKFNYTDLGAGLARVVYYKADGAVLYSSDTLRPDAYNFSLTPPLADGKYKQILTDNSGKTTTMWFRVDPASPRVELDHMDMAQNYTFSIYGAAQDTGSGMDFLVLSRNDALVKTFELTPGTTEQVDFSAMNLPVAGDGYYVVSAQDKTQNLTPPQVAQFSVLPAPAISTSDDHRSVGQHVTGISVVGEPCTVTVSAIPSTLPVPVNFPATTSAITLTPPEQPFVGDAYFQGSLSVVTNSTACTASVTGESVSSFVLGPKVSVARNSDLSQDAVYNYGLYEAELSGYRPIEGETPGVLAGGEKVTAPENNSLYPAGLELGFRLDVSGAAFDNLKVRMHGVGAEVSSIDLPRLRMMQYGDDGSVTDITSAHTANYVEGSTQHNSIFAVVAPLGVFDKIGPEMSLKGIAHEAAGLLYISSASPVVLQAVDRSTNPYVLAGVATSYYKLGAEPSAGCLAAPETCGAAAYSGPVSLPEGAHSLYSWSADKAGNVGAVKAAEIHSDGTLPVSELALNGAPITAGATVYATTADVLTLDGADVISNGVASGLATTYFLIDISPEECNYLDWSGGLDGMGTCENRFYGGPFNLPAGEHVLYFYGEDKVGNAEAIKAVSFVVAEAVAPVNIYPAAKTAHSVLWQWTLLDGATSYQVFSATGGALSPLLSGDTSGYLQENLVPNTVYGNRLVASTAGSTYESSVSTASTLAAEPMAIENFVTGQSADVVIGQNDFISNLGGYNENLYQFGMPYSVAIDIWGSLWVVDNYNARVLRFNPPFTNGMSASVVLGRAAGGGYPLAAEVRLRNPKGVSAARDGSLWVSGGSRVLQFKPPFYTGMQASLVIGQPDFTAWEQAAAINRFREPFGATVDMDGKLWVADKENNRVVRFDPPFSNGMDASLVLGQPDFNSGGSSPLFPSPKTFYGPGAVTEDEDGNLWVSDSLNGRVLKFTPPFASNMNASLVVGQKDLYSNCYSLGGCSISGNVLNNAFGAVFDNNGNLFVADANGNRVLKFKPPFSNGMPAAVVLGQENFSTSTGGLAANKLQDPMGTGVSGSVVVDPAGKLWVADAGNNRVLAFTPASPVAVSAVDWNSLKVSWVPGENPPGTQYAVEVSTSGDFYGNVFSVLETGTSDHAFYGLSPNTAYFARVKAINSDGQATDYVSLGVGRTKPLPPSGLNGAAVSSGAILWTWATIAKNLSIELFTSTGGILSGVLPSGSTSYLQSGLSPNVEHVIGLRVGNRSGYSDVVSARQTTLSNSPGFAKPFADGESADLVVGQGDFISTTEGVASNKLSYPQAVAFDASGDLWVADSRNNRVLKFPKQFSAGMSASVVIGQPDFVSAGSGTSPAQFSFPTAIKFDSSGGLWVADRWNSRILKFSPPFLTGMSASAVIGQGNYYSAVSATSQTGLSGPTGLAFDATGGLWVSDAGNSRVLKFAPPLTDGMPASVVLGQINFTTLWRMGAEPKYVSSPQKISIDPQGNLLVADYYHNRVVRFSAPFSNYMNASLVLGQQNLNSQSLYPYPGPSPENTLFPAAVVSDAEGTVYVGDTSFHRVTRFEEPLVNGKAASVVLGQPDFYSNGGAVAQNTVFSPADIALNPEDGALWVADAGYNRVVRFNRQSAFEVNTTSIGVKWDGNSNPVGTLYSVKLTTENGGAPIAQSPWMVSLTYAFENLTPETTYFASVRSKNFSGAESAETALGSVRTSAPVFYTVQSTVSIAGVPEVEFSAYPEPYINQLSTASQTGNLVLATATNSGIYLASNLYEIGPEGVYDPPGSLTFQYSTETVHSLDLVESELAVYEFFSESGWVRLEGQILDTLNHKITVPITRIASLFGIFGVVNDRTAPETNFLVAGSSWPMAAGGLYVGAASSITLTASDPVVFGTATGVAYTEFRIDSSTSAPFARYQDSLSLSTGPHKVEFRSVDNAGNTEEIKSVEVFADGQSPDLGYSIAGSSFAGVGVVYAALGSTVTLIASDAAAGVRSIFYELNGDTHTAASGSAEIFLHSGGAYFLSYFAEDYVGNMTSTAAVSLFVDTSAPVSALLLDNTPARDGWYTSALAAALGAADEGSGIRETLFSLDGSSFAVYAASFPVVAEGRHTIGFYSSDNVLNTETVRTAAFGIDTSTPIISYVLAPVPNTAGWNNSAVNVVFTGTDTVSGVEYCSSSFTISAEGLNIPAYGYCSDHAGWSSTATFTINIDTTMPVSYADISGASGLNGWFVSPAIVALAATDNLSGLAGLNYSVDGSSFVTYGSSVTVTGAGWHVLRYFAQDKAVNMEVEKRAEFKLDLNAPSVMALAEPQPNEHGWNNTAVRFVFSGTDTVSGLAFCEQGKIIELEGSSRTVTGYCMDYAGWSSTAALIVNIDTTAPIISYSALPAPNAVGWNNGDVGLKFSCEDNLSGVMQCPADILLDGEGVNVSTAAKAYDYAGNFAQVEISGLKIDRTRPVSSATLSGTLRNGWYASTVGIVLTSTDALSGIRQILYSLDDGEFLAYSGPLNVSSEGSHSLKFHAEDNAGNAEAAKTISFSIDASAPIVAYGQTPAANAAGWNNSSVYIVFSGTDTFSGVEDCSSDTITSEGAAQSVPGWCRDLAGNIGYATATLNIDMTPAGISMASPQAGQTFIATRGRFDIGFAITDNLDPAPGVEAFLVQLEDKGSPRGQRSAKIAVAAGQAIEPLDIDDGLWQLMVNATDFALNTSSALSGAFEVIHDVLAPRSELAVSGALYSSTGGVYATSAAKFSLTSIDDLVSPEDAIGLGVKEQSVGLKSGGLTLKELTFLAPAPQPGMVFISTFSLGSLGSLPDGSYDVAYTARDVIGNAAAFVERRYLLDNTAPFTQYAVAGTAHLADGKLYLNSTAALSLTAVDVSSGGVAAGLMLTKYRLDGGNWVIYSSSFAISATGAHTLEYYSLDNVQNAESIRTLNLVVDNTAPATAISVGEPQFNVFGLWIMTPETPVTLTAADAGVAGLTAGVKGIYYELIADGGSSSGANNYTEPFKIGAQGTYTVRYWSVDNAGNTETPKELRLMVSSLQNDALDSVEGLAMTGSADIAGTVKSNKVVSLGGNARILGDVSASTITVTGNAQITGQRFAGSTPLAPAPLYMPAIVEIASNTNNNSLIPAKYLSGEKLVVSAKDEITLSTGIYYFSGIELKGGASIVLNGKVDILVAGDVAMSGGSSFNAAGTASRLNIFLSTASSLNFSGGANLAAYVYAPYAELKLAGNTLLGGHYFVRSAAVSGNGNLLQAGETLPVAAPVVGGGKKVSALASGSSYSVLAGPDPEFKLGEVYVYPNPAKNGQVPVIHLECGIADSVNIKIYTVSGREAHEYTLTSAPVALDDGNGLSYAYEYAWNGRIPSGVYYYFIEAERAGKKLKKTGKFAVVR